MYDTSFTSSPPHFTSLAFVDARKINSWKLSVKTCIHKIKTRAENTQIESWEMCKLKKFLSILAIVLNWIFVIEVGYFCWLLANNHKNFSIIELIVSIFINFSIVFFAAVAVIGVVQSNLLLLGTWLVYAIVELSRSSIVLYDSWTEDADDKLNEKLRNTCDVGVQAMAILTICLLVEIIKAQKQSRAKISTIERSIELNRRHHEKLKPIAN